MPKQKSQSVYIEGDTRLLKGVSYQSFFVHPETGSITTPKNFGKDAADQEKDVDTVFEFLERRVDSLFAAAGPMGILTNGFEDIPTVSSLKQRLAVWAQKAKSERGDTPAQLMPFVETIKLPIPDFLPSDQQEKFLRHFMKSAGNVPWVATVSNMTGKPEALIMISNREIGTGLPNTRLRFSMAPDFAKLSKPALRNISDLWRKIVKEVMPLEMVTAQKACFHLGNLAPAIRQAFQAAGEMGNTDTIAAEIIDMEGKGIIRRLLRQNGFPAGLYTLPSVRDEEEYIVDLASRMASERTHFFDEDIVNDIIATRETIMKDQEAAVRLCTQPNRLVVIEGWAGTGKSFVTRALEDGAEAQGYNFFYLSPTNAVAADMRNEGIDGASTAHKLIRRLSSAMENGETRLAHDVNDNTIFVIDEAQMIDNKVLTELLEIADRAGAKVIMVGSKNQLPSISRGGMYSYLVDHPGIPTAHLQQIYRHRNDPYKRAAEFFAKGEYHKGLKIFDDMGWIKWCDTRAEAKTLMRDLIAEPKDKDGEAIDYSERLVLAYTNRDVAHFNDEVQNARIGAGDIVNTRAYTVVKEKDGIPVERKITIGVAANENVQGTRILFNKNDKNRKIINGQMGFVEGISEDGEVSVRMDDGRPINFYPDEFPYFDLAYATTIHKGQGITFDDTVMLYSGHWRVKAAYVALTRARDEVALVVSHEDLGISVAKNGADAVKSKRLRLLATQLSQHEEDGVSLLYNIEDAPKSITKTRKTEIEREVAIALSP